MNINNTYKHIPPFDNTTYTCTTTAKTFPVVPNSKRNETKKIMLGNCDNGTLVFTVHSDKSGKTVVVPTYYPLAVASPTHTCNIDWNYTYLLPSQDIGSADESLLPGCFSTVTLGPEDIQILSYWFYILEWDVSAKGIIRIAIYMYMILDGSCTRVCQKVTCG